ncbi:MAG: thiolase family protein [Candidatus Dormibacterales bacterium]
MRFEKVFVPYGVYWSTPFVRWQGSFAGLHPLEFGASVAARAMGERGLEAERLDALHLGNTVPSRSAFYGAPWVAGMLGAEGLTGPTVNQACATSARLLAGAGGEVEAGAGPVLALAADRTSNGPHLYYPNPAGAGGRGESEDWVWDNFEHDPHARNAMVDTAENVALAAGISRAEQEEVVLLRHLQYQDALADGRRFQRRYMVSPIEVRDGSGRRVVATVESDEGVHPTSAEGLASLKPVRPGGTVTFGTQTHPADGSAGMVVASRAEARALAREDVPVRLLSFGQARARRGHMAEAVVPAARQALADAGAGIGDMAAVKTHNPFAVNDVYLAREMDLALDSFNRYGSSLVFGHPQGPTGLRLVMELIEELALLGGGLGLFTGCAAGDTAAALVVRVG